MNQRKKYANIVIAACALLGGIGSASAATEFTWKYNSTYSSPVFGHGGGSNANSAAGTTTAPGLSLSYTGWSNTRMVGGDNDGTANAQFMQQRLHGGAYNLSLYTTTYASCNEASSSSCGYPHHSIDNNGAQEFVLFAFSEAVVLNELAIGWPDSGSLDTDMTVAAYTGGGAMPTMGSLSSADILSGDFYIEHLANVPKDNTDGSKPYGNIAEFNAGSVASQYWLVGAYNHHLGGNLSSNNDYVKLALLGGEIPDAPCVDCGGTDVPEPMTLGLLGIGLLGLRRRRRVPGRC